MIKLTTAKLAEILQAKLIGDPQVVVESISTDTRQKVEAGLFFALKGERFDAHHYVENAVQQGCVALVVEREVAVSIPQILVKNTTLALGQLGAWLKAELNPKTVAMTGSSGKTTVKEMTAAILSQFTEETAVKNSEVLFTNGNFNNDIGVPLTLLRLEPQHQFAVIELGANHANEIDYTTHLVRPDVALVNNVAPAHLEGFGSIEGVARAKGEIYRGLAEDGIAVINLDCCYPELWAAEIGQRQLQSFSLHNSAADFFASEIELTETGSVFNLHSPQGQIQINLPYLGQHNISNALAATALAMNVGANLAQIKAGLEQKSMVKGRLFPIQVNENVLLLDDTYNANVDSMKSAIQVLQKYQGFRILAVGDMAELGENTTLCHQQVAEATLEAKLDLVASFGVHSQVISAMSGGKHFSDKNKMCEFLTAVIKEKQEQNQKVVLLAKGSRSQRMEQLIEMLQVNLKG